jgi:hypothetical protein
VLSVSHRTLYIKYHKFRTHIKSNSAYRPKSDYFQSLFLTIAKKNKTKMARVIETDKISPIGGSSKIPMVSSKAPRISWIAKREKAIAANIIFFRPDLLYAKSIMLTKGEKIFQLQLE